MHYGVNRGHGKKKVFESQWPVGVFRATMAHLRECRFGLTFQPGSFRCRTATGV